MAHPFFDPSLSLGQLSFRLYYGEVLRQALQEARDGNLDPQWRENVANSSVLSGLLSSPDPYGVHLSVVTAINEMPRAAWQPGHSPGWRAALDSWFDDSRNALAEHRTMTLAQQANATKPVVSLSVAALVTTSPSDTIARIARIDAMHDQTAKQTLSTFIVQRDKLTASYMAALAAGGLDVDWRSWFEDRINTWDSSVAIGGARMTLQQEHSYLERLPTYW
jgi:hypothetical protein